MGMTTDDDDRTARRPRSLKLVLGTAATVVVLAGAGGAALGAAGGDAGDTGPGHRFPGGQLPPWGGGDLPDPAA
jgi:hypothetical protein